MECHRIEITFELFWQSNRLHTSRFLHPHFQYSIRSYTFPKYGFSCSYKPETNKKKCIPSDTHKAEFLTTEINYNKKGKVIPLQARCGPEGG